MGSNKFFTQESKSVYLSPSQRKDYSDLADDYKETSFLNQEFHSQEINKGTKKTLKFFCLSFTLHFLEG